MNTRVKLESHDKMDYLVQNVFGVVVDRSSIGIEFVLRGIPVYHFFDDIHHSPFGMCNISLSIRFNSSKNIVKS